MKMDVSRLVPIWSSLKAKYNSRYLQGFVGGDDLAKYENPIVGVLAFRTPDDVLWLKSEVDYHCGDDYEDYYDVDQYGIRKNGDIIWVDIKMNYTGYFDKVNDYFSRFLPINSPASYDGEMGLNVFMDVYDLEDDASIVDELKEKIDQMMNDVNDRTTEQGKIRDMVCKTIR